jgi:hypothetical protein
MLKLRDYLQLPSRKTKKMVVEASIDKADMNWLYSILEKPKTSKYTLRSSGLNYTEDEREVAVYLRNNTTLTFSYNRELDEFTDALVDVLDTLRLKFKAEEERNINTINVVVGL